jgi:hypothetical protein
MVLDLVGNYFLAGALVIIVTFVLNLGLGIEEHLHLSHL